MIELQPYPAYKPSGVDWLGGIPSHWGTGRLQHSASINHRTLPENTDGDTSFDYIDIGSVETGKLAEAPERMTFDGSPSRARRVVSAGDTIISTVRTYLKAVYHFESVHDLIVVSTGFATLSPIPGTHCGYLKWAVISDVFVSEVERQSTGVSYPAINESKLGKLRLPLPPLDEQRAIADYLDRKDAEITRFIDSRRRMIALLEEKKQAIINQAVTKGLDPSVPMKDSGVEWLGEIPAHWEVRRLKDWLREIDFRSETGEEELLSVSHITGVTRRSEKNVTMFVAQSYIGSKLCWSGDIVANTMWMWMGAIGTSDMHGIVSPSYAVYRPQHSDLVDGAFADSLLRLPAMVDEYTRLSTGIHASRLRLYPDSFLNIQIPVPPFHEQVDIAGHLERMIVLVAEQSSHMHREIELIQEYRTRLISDVVTGKVKVT